MKNLLLTLVYLLIAPFVALGSEADVLDVKIEKTDDGYLNVHATVQHDDEGWEHYADSWEILDMHGDVLDKRVLRHPHSSTPFTRSILRARIPKDTTRISVRAHDTVHGYGGAVVEVMMPVNE